MTWSLLLFFLFPFAGWLMLRSIGSALDKTEGGPTT